MLYYRKERRSSLGEYLQIKIFPAVFIDLIRSAFVWIYIINIVLLYYILSSLAILLILR